MVYPLYELAVEFDIIEPIIRGSLYAKVSSSDLDLCMELPLSFCNGLESLGSFFYMLTIV